MLGIEDFAEQLENDLNTIASGITGAIPFKIFTNLGDYTEAYRVLNDVEMYQFGILRVLPSELVPIKGLQVQNFVFQLECAVNIDRSEKDENGNYVQVVNTQTILNNYAQSMTGTTGTITASGKSYTVAYAINPCTVSSVTMTTSDYGEVLPIQLTIEVGAVENGVNLNDIDYYIDGEPIYPLSVQATRKRTPQENAFSNKSSTSIGMLQNGFGLDLQMPLLYNSLGETILDDIYEGKDNVAHCVNICFNKYIIYEVWNIGDGAEVHNINYSLYSYNAKNNQIQFSVTIPSNALHLQLFRTTGTNYSWAVNWGDDSENSLSEHLYANAGNYTITLTLNSTTISILDSIEKREKCYIMTFGNTNHNTSANTNISPQISLVEGVQHILSYGGNWTETTINSDGNWHYYLVEAGQTLFMGDGTYYYASNYKQYFYHKYPVGTFKQKKFTRS